MLATDEDGRDNTIIYDIIFETEFFNTSASGEASGDGIEEPDHFNFSINAEGAISNVDLFPTIAEDEVLLTLLPLKY